MEGFYIKHQLMVETQNFNPKIVEWPTSPTIANYQTGPGLSIGPYTMAHFQDT